MTTKPPRSADGQSPRDRGSEQGARHARHSDENAAPNGPRRDKAPRRPQQTQPARQAENIAQAEAGAEGRKGPPHRRRQRVATHAPKPVSTTPIAVGGARPASQAAGQRPSGPAHATSAANQEEAVKSPESKVFIYTYTIWNRSTSS